MFLTGLASGKKRAVLARHVRNRRLYDAIDHWALCSLTNSPGARAFSTSTAPPATSITKPYALWATDSSESCTAAFATTPPTAKPPHGHTAKSLKLLDELRPWDVYTGAPSGSACLYGRRVPEAGSLDSRRLQFRDIAIGNPGGVLLEFAPVATEVVSEVGGQRFGGQ